MQLFKETVWIIMTKDRKYVAKGTPRNRYLISVDDKEDKKRYLTYSSKGKAEAGFKCSGFYGTHYGVYGSNDYEAVEVELIMNIETTPSN